MLRVGTETVSAGGVTAAACRGMVLQSLLRATCSRWGIARSVCTSSAAGICAAAVLLANHGPVVSAKTFRGAVMAAEELEETAKLILLTRGMNVRRLSAEAVAELQKRFK